MSKYDPQEALTLYLCGMSVSEVAREYDVPKNTMYNFLKSRVEIRPDPGGIPRQEKCRRGHSMDDAIVKKDDSRECRVCKQARDKRYKARRQQRRVAARSTQS